MTNIKERTKAYLGVYIEQIVNAATPAQIETRCRDAILTLQSFAQQCADNLDEKNIKLESITNTVFEKLENIE